MRFFLGLLLAACGTIGAQRISVGVTGGIPVTNTFDIGFIHAGSFDPKTVRYTVGPAAEFHLHGPLRLEVNALYQPFSFNLDTEFIVPSYSHTSGSLWQFPALVELSLPLRRWHPFVETGPSFQVATGITRSTRQIVQTVPFADHPDPTRRAVAGIVAGGGFDFRLRHLTISPQVRYTYWIAENFDFTESSSSHAGSHLNQVQVLLSLRFW